MGLIIEVLLNSIWFEVWDFKKTFFMVIQFSCLSFKELIGFHICPCFSFIAFIKEKEKKIPSVVLL